jgi:superfamily II DNA helicase RecQ
MAFLTQFASFFISPFGEPTVCEELNKFLRSHRILNLEKRLIDGERATGWLFLVEYSAEQKSQQQASTRVDYREVLSQHEYVLFDRLRQLRKDLSEKNGVPVYAIFTNEQLASMVKSPPTSEKDFQSYPGVGESRVKQYGEEFLSFFTNDKRDKSETGK